MGKAVHDTDKEFQRQVEVVHSPGKNEKASGRTMPADKNSHKKIKDEPEKGSLKLLWKHADYVDKLLMFLGTLGCIVDGSSGTAKIFIVGGIMDSYGGSSGTSLQDINNFALIFLYAAIGFGLGASLEGFCWARTAERQASRLRSKYLQAVLRQDVGFFYSNRGSSMTSQVATSISTDTLVVQGFLSEKVPYFLTNMTMFFAAQLGGLYLCWRLGLIAIPCLLLLIIPGLMVGKLLAASQKRSQQSYAIAGGVVQQALSSIKTVYSYVAEQQTVNKFSTALHPTLEIGIQQGLLKGYAIGSTGVVCAVWSLLAWYGSVLVTEKGIKGSNAFNSATLVINGGLCLGGCLATLKHFVEAKVAAASIFKMIERVPSIDSSDQKGVIVENVQGGLEFKDIDFAYPSRPDSLVMRKFNLKVNPCETIGLVGGSGSGKSTVINLLERFYDPLKGEVLLDGVNIKDLQLKWLRKQMALVNQEPILFATSIKDNILFGKGEASEEEIIQAAKAANAHDFIARLPNGYDTLVGQLGTQMSGGQKQRISIARALLTNPRILLLDEATSALDSHSEKAVQDALNEAAYGRTTLIVAHRFSALHNADSIAVVRSGQVVEFGPPNELLNKKYGAYSTMVQQQKRLMHDETSRTPDITQLKGTPFIGPGASPSRPISSPELSPFQQQRKTEQGQSQENSTSKFWTLVRMSSSQLRSTLLGSIGAIFYGFIQPWQAYCLGALLAVYFTRNDSEIRSETRIYCFAFLGFGICTIVTSVLQHYYFGIMGENLTKKLREAITEKILSFEIEWFDRDENNTGAVSAKLAKDATMVKTLVSDTVSFVIQSLSGITLAMVLSLVLAWKISIVIIAMQPIVIATLYLRVTTMKRMSRKIFKSQNKSSELASEAVSNHRIITAFYSQDKILELFESAQIDPKKESRKQSWYAAIGLFTSQFVTSANLAVVFWYGGKLIFRKEISFKELFQTFGIMLTTGNVMAQAGSRIADMTKGMTALKSIFKILKRHSKMEPDDLNAIIPAKVDGKIEFIFVEFFYPTRPKQMILNNFNLAIEAGKVVALVGQSGSGKSTVIKLIERFYDPTKGTVLIDGIDIKDYNLRALRSNIAWVSQEPNLFAGTIYENIAYGTENATEAEVIEAAKLANAHEFISSMPDGYGTHCGERGVQLSGGQKQRIALARAILKNPPILLLDEATSALDIQSENLVQEALEKTMIGRTCVIVAHRLSTIQRSDRISVVENGTVVEEGSHNQLLAKGEMGAYYALVKLQHESALR